MVIITTLQGVEVFELSCETCRDALIDLVSNIFYYQNYDRIIFVLVRFFGLQQISTKA